MRPAVVGIVALVVGGLVALGLLHSGAPDDVTAPDTDGADEGTGVALENPQAWPNGNVTGRNNLVGVRRELLAFFAWWNVNGPFALRVTSGIRTDAEQRKLYAQGRTTAGVIVTNAQTARDSAHGRGAACDAYPFAGGKLILDTTDSRWEAYGFHAERFGLAWGGRWLSLKDNPHVEVIGWRSFAVPDGVVS